MAHYSTVQKFKDLVHTQGKKTFNNPALRLLPEILEAHPELKLNTEIKLSREFKMRYPKLEKHFGESTTTLPDYSNNPSVASTIKTSNDTVYSASLSAPLPEDMDGIIHSETPVVKPLANSIWSSSKDVFGDFVQVSASKVDKRAKQIPHLENGNSLRPSYEVNDQQSMIEYEVDAPTAALIDKWQGTAVLHQPEWLITGSKSLLEKLIVHRSAAEKDIQRSPYDPESWIHLTQVYHSLCYPDLQVSTAYRTLILIRQGLDFSDRSIGQDVRSAIVKRLSCDSAIVVACELDYQRLEAYKALLSGLRDLGAYFDGMSEAKTALRFYPEDDFILDLYKHLKDAFETKANILEKSKLKPEEIKFLSRSGRTHKRRYPWLQEELFHRTPALVADINIKLNSSNCEIRQVSFGRKLSELSNPNDVGPLGVFAKQDIKKDEVVLIDENIPVVSRIQPSKMAHCDACQACLSPLVHISGSLLAQCCKAASYCSEKCRDAAVNGYHKVVCGQDFSWIYKNVTSEGQDPTWRPLILLRIFAIVVADQRASPRNKKVHPLKHPLLVRLTEGYASSVSNDESEHEWSYTSNVVAPTKILLQLGVDIFTCLEWSPEVLHTIYWREVNNACRLTSLTIKDDEVHPNPLSGIGPNYVLFNHSCDANVNWMAAGGGLGVTVLGQLGMAIKVGCNSLLCIAARDIKKGEECRISYVPSTDRKQLHRWFEGGCGCALCEKDGGTAFDDAHDELDSVTE